MILLVMIHIITSQGDLQNNNLLDKPIPVKQNMRTYDTLHSNVLIQMQAMFMLKEK